MNSFMDIAVFILLLLFLIGTPVFLTVINVILLVRELINKPLKEVPRNRIYKIVDVFTLITGIACTLVLWSILDFKEYELAIRTGRDIAEVHTPLAGKYLWSFLLPVFLGYVSYFVIELKKTHLPPLLFVVGMSSILIAIGIQSIYLYQLKEHAFIIVENHNFLEKCLLLFYNPLLYLTILPFNFILCSIKLLKQVRDEYLREPVMDSNNKWLAKVNDFIMRSKHWSLIALIIMLPLLIVIIMILVLVGQEPEGMIKVFTETSDWALSQRISPPLIEGHSHYLCTVALQGHQEVVKPKRVGLRRGNKILVNRQLMIANAFEEVIQQKLPKTHHLIRYVYDRYGFPLSKVITTPLRADITYILMKPLEYIFLIFLYLVDLQPETRIARQYLPLEM